jgi:hypothetical protein
MGFKEWIIPQEHHFFDLLSQQADIVLKGAIALDKLSHDFTDAEVKTVGIHDIEHEGDALVHNVAELLNKTFVTPIDHDDLSKLTSKMDDVLDYIDAGATRIRLYEIKELPKPMLQLIDVLMRQVNVIHEMIHLLEHRKDRNKLLEKCVEINRLENMADEITHGALAGLFKLDDIKMIMKLKEIYEHFELATDRCEDVADIVKDVIIKNS